MCPCFDGTLCDGLAQTCMQLKRIKLPLCTSLLLLCLGPYLTGAHQFGESGSWEDSTGSPVDALHDKRTKELHSWK